MLFDSAFCWQNTQTLKDSLWPVFGTSMQNSFALSVHMIWLQMVHTERFMVATPIQIKVLFRRSRQKGTNTHSLAMLKLACHMRSREK
jgi:hypothetical protein